MYMLSPSASQLAQLRSLVGRGVRAIEAGNATRAAELARLSDHVSVLSLKVSALSEQVGRLLPTPQPSLVTMPGCILETILFLLPVRDRVQCQLVCKTLCAAVSNTRLWRYIRLAQFSTWFRLQAFPTAAAMRAETNLSEVYGATHDDYLHSGENPLHQVVAKAGGFLTALEISCRMSEVWNVNENVLQICMLNCKSLCELRLNYGYLTAPRVLQFLAAAPSLRLLQVWVSCTWSDAIRLLDERAVRIARLWLQRGYADVEQPHQLGEALRSHAWLRALTVENSLDFGALPLLEGVTGHSSLQTLHISLRSYDAAASELARQVGCIIAANAPSLKKIEAGGKYSEDLISLIIAGLFENTNLQELSCGFHDLSPQFEQHTLMPALFACSSLQKIYFDGSILDGPWTALKAAAAYVKDRHRSRGGQVSDDESY